MGQPVTSRESYTHSGLEMAMFVGPGRECRVELCKKLVSMMKNELRPLGRAIVRGPCTPKVSSNATTKTPDLGMYTRVKRKEIFTKSLQFDSVKRPDLKKRRAVIQISDDRRLNSPLLGGQIAVWCTGRSLHLRR